MGRYNVVNSIWYGTIGIVKVKTEFGGTKYYMREAKGLNQDDDEQYIATYGYPVYPDVIKDFLS